MVMPTIQDLRGLPDPLLQHRWTLIVPNMPGGGDTRRLQYQCQVASIPGLTAEEVLVTSHGIDLRYAGRETYNGSLSCTFYETRDLIVYRSIRNWKEYARNPIAGSGSYKEDYATTAQLLLVDDQLKEISRVDFIGFFPGELQESNLDGSSNSPVQFNVTFRFDYSILV